MLKVKNLTFEVNEEGKKRCLVNHISFDVQDGEMLVITGPNGGGKSTLAKVLAGIEKANSGEIYLDDENITGYDIDHRANAGIGYAFQQPPRFKGMTVARMLSLAAGKNLTEKESCDLLSAVGLCSEDYLNRQLDGTLSGGEMKRIEIATVLAKSHKVSIFDEPEAGIDLWSFSMLIKRFEEIHREKKECLILISHQEKIINMADKIMVIEDGEVKKYGTKEELKEMIDELHKNHISVYLDVVLNHKAGGDFTEKFIVVEVDPNDRTQALGKPFEIQGWTGYSFHGRKDKYSDFKWHWYHFSGTGFDDAKKRSGIFQIQGEGKAWSEGVDNENGNYDFLLCNDIDLDHPEVVTELNRWGKWVSKELNLDGMRLDAIKHMKDKFIAQFLDAVRSERGDKFYAVGEYWNGDLNTLDAYIKSVGHKVNLFDVPLHYNLFQASQEGKNYDLQNILKNTLVEHHCDLAVTFVDNHDSQSGSSLESQIEDWFKPLAYGLILLMKDGYPCLFYGDYYGVKGENSPHTQIINILLDTRRKYAYGDQIEYFDHPSAIGFIRTGDEEHVGSGLVFLMSNDEAGSKKMDLGEEHKGEIWHEITGNIQQEITLDEKGSGEFSVNTRNIAVWIKKN